MAHADLRKRAPAAISASSTLARRPVRGTATAASGRYSGWTQERVPRAVSFRFLGRGIRDLRLGERLAAQWLPADGPELRQNVRGATIAVKWDGPRSVSGSVARRRSGRLETVRFTAAHDFGA